MGPLYGQLSVDTQTPLVTFMYQAKASEEKIIHLAISKIGKGDAKEITYYLNDKDINEATALYECIIYVVIRNQEMKKINSTARDKYLFGYVTHHQKKIARLF
jgi:hypothetical protein